MTSGPLEFGPRRLPVWIARISGIGAFLLGAVVLAAAVMVASEGAFFVVFLGVFGLCALAFGWWIWVNGSRMAKLRAVVTPDALHIVAHSGRHLWFQRGLAEAAIPWGEVQGLTDVRVLNPAAPNRTQNTYILYTQRGDFTLNDVQWNDLEGLMREVSARSGRAPGEIAPERSAVRAEVKAGQRRLYSFQRILGWILVVGCAPLLLLLVLGGCIDGFSGDLARVAVFLAVGLALGVSMIRFYRKQT
jgi:hypothetical protein